MATLSVPTPDLIRVQRGPRGAWRSPSEAAAVVDLRPDGDGLSIAVSAVAPLSRVHLRWRRSLPSDALVLGDARDAGRHPRAGAPERISNLPAWSPVRAGAARRNAIAHRRSRG